ncbi:hypothetical protein IEQ34_001448 [Dendrobium chrysotoxum]|uniref:Uncharacterized protein n=1 Tax=Dendrobium chrysotoxum TaxID=161865 RepID=A0AAV7H6V6_DENCH|nr:hypothetical protein IEQ34_001448 [Dendrobium chrysotoxum]
MCQRTEKSNHLHHFSLFPRRNHSPPNVLRSVPVHIALAKPPSPPQPPSLRQQNSTHHVSETPRLPDGPAIGTAEPNPSILALSQQSSREIPAAAIPPAEPRGTIQKQHRSQIVHFAYQAIWIFSSMSHSPPRQKMKGGTPQGYNFRQANRSICPQTP